MKMWNLIREPWRLLFTLRLCENKKSFTPRRKGGKGAKYKNIDQKSSFTGSQNIFLKSTT